MNARAQSKLLIKTIEICTEEIADGFPSTKEYVYYEGDLQCMFFQKLREQTVCWRGVRPDDRVPLVHAEYPTKVSYSRRYDIAVWDPSCARIIRSLYGQDRVQWVPSIDVLAGMELQPWDKDIDTPARVNKLLNDCDQDMQKLIDSSNGVEFGYLFVFMFLSLDDPATNRSSYQRLRTEFQRRVNSSPNGLKVFVAVGDGQISKGKNWEWITKKPKPPRKMPKGGGA